VQRGLCCCWYGVCTCNCVSGWTNSSRVSSSPVGLGRAITMRSSVQRRRLAARLSRGVLHARLVLTRTLLARPLLMPLPRAYTSLCTVQLRRRVVNLASPLHWLNASCTALRMHHTAPPLRAIGLFTCYWYLGPQTVNSLSDLRLWPITLEVTS